MTRGSDREAKLSGSARFLSPSCYQVQNTPFSSVRVRPWNRLHLEGRNTGHKEASTFGPTWAECMGRSMHEVPLGALSPPPTGGLSVTNRRIHHNPCTVYTATLPYRQCRHSIECAEIQLPWGNMWSPEVHWWTLSQTLGTPKAAHAYSILVGVHDENLGGKGLNLRIILKCIVTKFGLWSRVTGFCEHGNRLFGSV
jgi:hypothetical protein